FRDRAARHSAQEEVEKSLTGRGVIEDVAEERRERGLLDKGLQAVRGAFEAPEKEMVNGGITGDELRRMQVPALEETVPERMHVVVEAEPPGGVNGLAILTQLIVGQRFPFARAMRTDGQDVRCAIGKMNARAG